MKRSFLLVLLVIMAAMSGIALGQKNKNVVVKSTIADAGADFMPLSIQSDLLGTYIHGSRSVVSQIHSIGDWEMSTLSSATRRVNVNFDDLVDGTNVNNLPTPMSGYHKVRFLTQCVYGMSLLNLASEGETARCGLIVAVDIGADRYSLRFYSKNFPGTDDITVACTSVESGKCSGWRTQSPNGDGKLIAQVYKVTTVKNKQVLTDYGKYRFSFDMSFVK